MESLLDALSEVQLVVEGAQEALKQAVHRAHDAGATWQQIADRLGVSKQTAWARYGKADEETAAVRADFRKLASTPLMAEQAEHFQKVVAQMLHDTEVSRSLTESAQKAAVAAMGSHLASFQATVAKSVAPMLVRSFQPEQAEPEYTD